MLTQNNTYISLLVSASFITMQVNPPPHHSAVRSTNRYLICQVVCTFLLLLAVNPELLKR